jgi:hypothetical protein
MKSLRYISKSFYVRYLASLCRCTVSQLLPLTIDVNMVDYRCTSIVYGCDRDQVSAWLWKILYTVYRNWRKTYKLQNTSERRLVCASALAKRLMIQVSTHVIVVCLVLDHSLKTEPSRGSDFPPSPHPAQERQTVQRRRSGSHNTYLKMRADRPWETRPFFPQRLWISHFHRKSASAKLSRGCTVLT